MRRNMKNKLCDLCGTPVRVVGDVTKHYEPIWEEEGALLGEDMKDKHVINRLNEALEILYFIHSEKHKHVIKAIKYAISVIEERDKLKDQVKDNWNLYVATQEWAVDLEAKLATVKEENEELKRDRDKWFNQAEKHMQQMREKYDREIKILSGLSQFEIEELRHNCMLSYGTNHPEIYMCKHESQLITLREAVLAFKLPKKLTGGMILCGVDFCKKEYEKVIEWHNKALDEIQPLLDKLKEVAK